MIQPAIIFDFGGVLIDWNPRLLFRKLFSGDEQAVDRFIEETHFFEWNAKQDAGRSFELGLAEIKRLFPDYYDKFLPYKPRFMETISGPIWSTVEILEQINQSGLPLFGLSNWSAETFPLIREKYQFLNLFSDIFLSGDVGAAKPDPKIFLYMLDKIKRDASNCLFIDDSIKNIEAADRLNFKTILYTSSQELRKDLIGFGVIE